MNILAIISEYNPFHNGHKYHIEESKKITNADYVICIMSGNFTQQGNISIIDKYTRANIAIQNGVDLVIELPTVFATSSAEFFSYNAVKILNDLNIVDYISFGSECEDINILINIANKVMKSQDIIWKDIKENLKNGYSFPVSRELAIKPLLTNDEYIQLSKSNNILAIEYIKALKKIKSKIRPILVKREGLTYNEKDFLNTTPKYISATSIRHLLTSNSNNLLNEKKYNKYIFSNIEEFVPSDTLDALKSNELLSNSDLFKILKYKISIMNLEDIKKINEITEGLENKIKSAIISSKSYEELVINIKSKRYTESKIRRCLINILLNITKDLLNFDKTYPHYAHILAINSNKKDLLSILSKNSSIPVIINYSEKNLKKHELNELQKHFINIDILASNIYSTLNNTNLNLDLIKKI